MSIGLDLGWGGILAKIRHYRQENLAKLEAAEYTMDDPRFSLVTVQQMSDFYDGIEDVALGMQAWIQHNADAAREMAETEEDPQLRQNLLEIAEMNDRLVTEPPQTFREACQWMLWYQMSARMYNGSGSMGRLDVLLTPFYERDIAAGILTDDEATFHIACLLLRDTAYLQVGGPDYSGKDVTNTVSYLVLEASHWLKIPVNVGVAVGESTDPALLRRGVEIIFEDKKGVPKFLGVDRTAEGFERSGYDKGWGYERAYSGCHWNAIPGREYTLNDCIKINFAKVFEVAWNETDGDARRRAQRRQALGRLHLPHEPGHSCDCVRAGLPRRIYASELPGTGAGLAMLRPHRTRPGRFPRRRGILQYGSRWFGLGDRRRFVRRAWSSASKRKAASRGKRSSTTSPPTGDRRPGDGENARLMMRSIPRYGTGGTPADKWTQRVSQAFTDLVNAAPTPGGIKILPGLFSWANTIPMGKVVGATPNGRHAGDPIAHGSNPDPGFRKDGAPTAMAVAIASVQPSLGNTAPMQMELDPALSKDEGGVDHVANLIKTHFDLGGTQINLNIMDKEKVLEAHKDPSKYPDLVVRVTGFSAYFASLSPEFRQLVVDRIMSES